MPNEGLLQRSSTDGGVNYVSSRRNDKAKKDKRKSRKRSSSRRTLKSSLNSSNASMNMSQSDVMDFSTPEINVTTSTRASVSPAFYDQTSTATTTPSSSVFDYAGSKYVRPPAPPEVETENLLQSSANADPNDPLAGHENFQDEFEDEMDEIEMNARTENFVNLSEMEAKQKNRKRCRKGCKWICILLLLGAVVGTICGVVLSLGGKETKKTPQAVPEASKLLRLWCAEELDKGPGESVVFPLEPTEDCVRGCEVAECCWNPKSDYECTPETEQFCEGYKSPCKIMTGYDAEPQNPATQLVVPTPPATLKTTCVPSGPSFTATKVCYDMCARADCCWNTTSTSQCTIESFQANCAPYEEFCSFFNEHPPQHATTAPAAPAPADNVEDDLPFPYASPELTTFCAVDTMEQNGPDACKQECNVAECCWKVGTVSCSGTDVCRDYEANCAVLNSLSSTTNNDNNNGGNNNGGNNNAGNTDSGSSTPFPKAPDGLSVYCSPSEMEEISLHICQDKCEPAACCWSSDADTCDGSVSAEMCQPYVQACAILNDLTTYPGNEDAAAVQPDDTVPAPPSDFSTRCAKANIIGALNGGDVLIQCERDCLAASCCWQPDVDGCTDDARCPAYEEHCSVFVGLFENGGSGSNTNTGSSGGNSGSSGSSSSSSGRVPQAPSDLSTTCAPEVLTPSVNSGAGIVQCERECLPAACCWKPDSINDCVGEPECAAYMEPCATNLVASLVALETGQSIAQVSGTKDTDAAKEIASACDNQMAIFVKSKCEDACRPGNCCFDDSLACPSSVDCSIYDPCGVLFRRNLRH